MLFPIQVVLVRFAHDFARGLAVKHADNDAGILTSQTADRISSVSQERDARHNLDARVFAPVFQIIARLLQVIRDCG